VIPFGTSNVLAKELAITSQDDAIDRILAGKRRKLTVGYAETEKRKTLFSSYGRYRF